MMQDGRLYLNRQLRTGPWLEAPLNNIGPDLALENVVLKELKRAKNTTLL